MTNNVPKYEIQPMSKSDIEEVMQLASEANLSFWSYKGYQSELENKDSVCLVAKLIEEDKRLVKNQNEIIGFLVSRLIILEDYADLLNIGIKLEYRHQKIGKKFLYALIKQCTDNSLERINLEVRVSNKIAINFYNKFGFKVLTINKNFYRNPIEDAYIMVKILNNDQKT